MTYEIEYITHGRSVDKERWSGSLEEAKLAAESAVRNGASAKVEIRNESNELIYEYPRPLGKPRS